MVAGEENLANSWASWYSVQPAMLVTGELREFSHLSSLSASLCTIPRGCKPLCNLSVCNFWPTTLFVSLPSHVFIPKSPGWVERKPSELMASPYPLPPHSALSLNSKLLSCQEWWISLSLIDNLAEEAGTRMDPPIGINFKCSKSQYLN